MKVAICGGGLIGSLCAGMLGKKGHEVDVYEHLPDPRSPEGKRTQGRSINLAVSTRGKASLAVLGLDDLILSNSIPMKGRFLHNSDGSQKINLYDVIGNDAINSTNRSYLSEVIVKAADQFPNVTFHYNHKVHHVDFDRGTLTLSKNTESNTEKEVVVKADLIIGADGAHSAVRKSLLRRPGTNFKQTYIDHGYLELHIHALENGQHAFEKNYLHIWPRSSFMLIAAPNMDGSFTATFFMRFDTFDEVKKSERVEDFLEKYFPDVINMIGRECLVNTFLNKNLSHLLSIECYPLHAGNGVIIGDAAHAMVPFYAQGMNAGFEDVLILDEFLSTCTDVRNIEKTLSKFTANRSKDAVAICELAMDHYLEMAHTVNQPGFVFRRVLDIILNRIMGNAWIPFYHTVTFTRIPYSECISNRKWQDKVLWDGFRCTILTFIVLLIAVIFF